MNKEEIKDIIIRMFKTFIQGFLAVLIVELKEADLTDMNLLKSVLIGALAGGISAVMNLFLTALPKNEDTEASGDLNE